MDSKTAASRLKKLAFSKSWQNNFITKAKQILNFETGHLEPKTLGMFVYIPAPVLIQALSSDRDFLSFRIENKTTKDYDYKLLADKTENNNRRLAVMYIAQFFKELDISFLIDDAYTIYITEEELQKLNQDSNPDKKDFYNSLYIPKHFGGRKGTEETWSH